MHKKFSHHHEVPINIPRNSFTRKSSIYQKYLKNIDFRVSFDLCFKSKKVSIFRTKKTFTQTTSGKYWFFWTKNIRIHLRKSNLKLPYIILTLINKGGSIWVWSRKNGPKWEVCTQSSINFKTFLSTLTRIILLTNKL